MKQTPAHEFPNTDLLALMPTDARRVVEVGSSSGALARAFKQLSVNCHYTGVEIDAAFAEASRQYCDSVVHASIENMDETTFNSLFPSDCWVFADSLEHLQDPWEVLRRVRGRISPAGSVVACIPNAQHWSMQERLNSGNLRYQDAGLMDRTHLRFFTRITVGDLFESTGFEIVEGGGRVFDEPRREKFLSAIGDFARAIGGDPGQAMGDATPYQWLVRAVPK